jgi:glycosyltransferase involved in cell wall biosynthesis
MFDDFPVAACVVASEWVKNMFEPYYGEKLSIWPTGIDTQSWIPSKGDSKSHDLLIYEKVRWDRDRVQRALVEPIVDQIRKLGLTYRFISYGRYDSAEYRVALNSSRAMLFLCEHESQGLAYQEAMSCDVPVLAWDPGQWLDPWRYRYGEGFVPATSVPYFDQRCGMSFTGLRDFGYKLNTFLQGLDSRCFRPRDFVLESLTLECCAQRYLDLLEEHCG